MDVIDLDRPAPRRPRPARRHARPLTAAAGVLVLGAALGAAGTHRWSQWRQERAQAAAVSVLVLADTGPQADDAGVGGTVLHDRVTDASLTRRVTLVNAGPLPIDVHNLAVDRPGLTVRGVDKQRWLKHGETAQADADITVRCGRGLPIGKLPVRLSVRTTDEHERTTTVSLDATEWNDQARLACDGALL
ncbi:hypothetical protein [Actinoplanes sp. N902-109]|uniref:hypothetical protein n=1 Tax=Actinoplanes sp. (strain N902-109) TaxID=649831 RepID=UPI00032965B9|nr:hypothetical protein [Actinoplanes sp. N902-109]AGL14324.1 hypothetical protein L083_0814 [Actinoplanes sp. N902-109]